jgi:haloacetate dehalogenase
MFDNFIQKQVRTKKTTVNLVQGGSGYPVLLLHGYPQTHVCWHLVAPLLAAQFTVVCADLRGCGDSGKPPGDAEHLNYSKRVMAQDQVDMMHHLGFDEFTVVGHDRGARVAHRMALDHKKKISKLALLDIIPTSTAFANVNKNMATAAFNWFFSIQPDELPERLIGAEPIFYLNYCLEHWSGTKTAFTEEAVAEYQRCFDREAIRATCEEFRAAATIDLVHDEADKEHKISCPTLLLWSAKGLWAGYNMIEIWKQRAENVQGTSFDCGHFLPEENAQQTAIALTRFLSHC